MALRATRPDGHRRAGYHRGVSQDQQKGVYTLKKAAEEKVELLKIFPPREVFLRRVSLRCSDLAKLLISPCANYR